MKKIARLTETLETEVPFIKEVTSLVNVEFIRAEDDLIEIDELMLDFPETQAALLELRDLVLKKPIYIGSLISKNATSAAIILEMRLSGTDDIERLRLDPKGGDRLNNLYPQVSYDKVKEILKRTEFDGINYYFSGDLQLNSIYNRTLESESGMLILITLVIIGITLIVFFRKWITGIAGPLIIVLLSLLMTVGIMGIIDFPITLFFLLFPTLSMTLLPLILAFSRMDHTAAGGGLKTSNRGPVLQILNSIIPFNLNHPKAILVVTLIIFIIFTAGAMRIKVAFDFAKDFKKGSEFRDNLEYVEKKMGGMMNIEYVFDTGFQDGIKDPDLLSKIEKVQSYADKHNIAKKTYSIIDIIKDMNQSFHMGDPAYFRLPDDRGLIAQYLMIYEMSGGEEFENYVTRDYSKTVMEIHAEYANSLAVYDFVRLMNQFIAKIDIRRASVSQTGIGYLWIKICDYISKSQINGYIIAFVVIILFMIIVFRSVRIGAIMTIPNLMPIITTLGVMGFMGMHLDCG